MELHHFQNERSIPFNCVVNDEFICKNGSRGMQTQNLLQHSGSSPFWSLREHFWLYEKFARTPINAKIDPKNKQKHPA